MEAAKTTPGRLVAQLELNPRIICAGYTNQTSGAFPRVTHGQPAGCGRDGGDSVASMAEAQQADSHGARPTRKLVKHFTAFGRVDAYLEQIDKGDGFKLQFRVDSSW